LDSPDPATASTAKKLVVFQYTAGVPAFNRGPIPCSGLAAGFSFRTTASGTYTPGGTSQACDASYWYPATASGQFLSLVSSAAGCVGLYNGAGMGGDSTWGHDGWFYVR
jgi:hypothetical protein